MITNFNASEKTKRPACCNFDCCGNHFGRIEHRYAKVHSGINRIIKTRRYAKRAERILIKREIELEFLMLMEDIEEFNYEMMQLEWGEWDE